jgi:hypothetical protein
MEGSSALIRAPEKKKRLLVEGKDDGYVIAHLLQSYQINLDHTKIELASKDSVTKLLHELPVELKASDLGHLGIVVDADTSLADRWRSLQDILNAVGYAGVPTAPQPDGTIIRQDDLPVVGIWVMPTNTLPGMLEHFMRLLVVPGDALWPLAEEVLQRVIAQDRRFPQNHEMKALIHTWLAWQESPGIPLGLAITLRYFDANASHAQQFIAWIRQLFDLGTP